MKKWISWIVSAYRTFVVDLWSITYVMSLLHYYTSIYLTEKRWLSYWKEIVSGELVLYLMVLYIILSLYIDWHTSWIWGFFIVWRIHQDKWLKFESAKSTDATLLAKQKKKERAEAKHGEWPFHLNKCNVITLLFPLPLSSFGGSFSVPLAIDYFDGSQL